MITLIINMVTTQFTDTNSLMYEIKTEDVYEDFSNHIDMFNFSNYLIKSKCCYSSNKLVVGRMEDKAAGVAIEEFAIEIFGSDNNEHKEAKGVNRNAVATISHNEYKDIPLNKTCLRHLIKMIESKDHKIGTYEINKISFSCVDDKIYIKDNGCDVLALGYKS